MNNKNIKIEYGENSFLTISPNEENSILKEKVKQFILLVENLNIMKTLSIIDDKYLEKINLQSAQDAPPYNCGRKCMYSGGILIEIQGPPLQIQAGNYHSGLQLKDIPQD